jgi:Putative DNA-binding domain
MPSLADLQQRVARAIVTGDGELVAATLLGGADPRQRLRIHQRHYETSLTSALRERYPATVWLAGVDLVTAAARAYVRARPPRTPCIAEYGGDFAQFLARYGRAADLPYLRSFAELEHAVADVSISTDVPPLTWLEVANIDPERLLDLHLTLQPGLRYLHSAWGVDELMTMYLADSAPATFVLPEADTLLELRGARGTVCMTRLDARTFSFRAALHSGRSIGTAAEIALERDETFDAGSALVQLTQAGLATRLFHPSEGVVS